MRSTLAVLALVACAFDVSAQLVISTAPTPQQLVQNILLGDGVTAFNITYNGVATPPPNQPGRGSFNVINSNLGLQSGVILASGNVMQAANPGTFFASTALNTGIDADLTLLAGTTIYDRSILTFDFIPTGDTLRFRYVFGSEEYPTYVCSSFNDAFGFFLSGPGITGPYSNNSANIALIPNTNIPVTINTVNSGVPGGSGTASVCAAAGGPNWQQNNIYYVNNQFGATVAYNGFTTVLTAFALVQCGQTYRIKIAVGDGFDTGFDSAVFLEAGSFTSTGQVNASLPSGTGVVNGNTMLEGCGPYEITFERTGDVVDQMVANLSVSGTATPGVDYAPALPAQIVFPPGQATVSVMIDVPLDPDGLETLIIGVTPENQPCSGPNAGTEFTYYIDSAPPISIQAADINGACGQSYVLAPVVSGALGQYSYTWSTGANTPTISVSPDVTTTYTLTVSAPCGADPVTANITVNLPVYDPITVDLGAPLEIECQGTGTITAISTTGGNGNYTYAWTVNGAPYGNGPSVTVPSGPPTWYVVTVTDGCGESIQDSLLVTSVPLTPIVVELTPYASTICQGTMVGLNVDDISGGGGTYSLGWTDQGGGSLGNGMGISVSPATSQTYTLTVTDQCGQSQVVSIPITVNAPSNAGAGTSITLCSAGAVVDLFGQLGGTPQAGGSWSGPNGPTGNNFDPTTGVSGTYTYTVLGLSPCPDVSATIDVTVNAAPNAGGNGWLTICSSGVPTDLFAQLEGSPQTGGTWVGPSGTHTGPFDPAVHLPGAYTYTIQGQAPCVSASASVQVSVSAAPSAGTNGALTLCSSDAAVALFSQLGGTPQAGGTWTNPSGGAFGGNFNPAVHAAGTYTYTVQGPAPCPPATATVTMSVNIAPNAGSNATLSLCSNQAPIDLFASLGGQPNVGGTWQGPNGAFSGPFDPAIHTAGSYTYTITGIAPCPSASASVNIGVTQAPNAGGSTALLLCPESAAIGLFGQLGGSPQQGGSWTGPGGIPSNGNFDPATHPTGVYTYTVSTGPACPPATATVTVSFPAQTPAFAGADAVSCSLSYTLAAANNWTSGTWSGPPGVVFADPNSPTSGVSANQGGSYTLTWSTVSQFGCVGEDQVTITLTVPMSATATATDANCHQACNGTVSVQATGGNLGQGGYTYSWPAGVSGNAAGNGANICAGDYAVTVSDMNGCTAQATFSVAQPPPVQIDDVSSVRVTCPGDCDGSIAVNAPDGVSFSVDNGLTWQGEAEFTGLCAGNWTVAVQDAAGCVNFASIQIPSPPPVTAGFTWSPFNPTALSPGVWFQSVSSSDVTTWAWNFGGAGTDHSEAPFFLFPGILGGSYTVCLTVTNADGCSDEICRTIVVRDELEGHLPNAFTPDGDGLNDVFIPVFTHDNVVDFEFMIFDRWGERLFQTTDRTEGWDGTLGGQMVKSEVYVWILRFRDPLSSDRVERRGHVTVLR